MCQDLAGLFTKLEISQFTEKFTSEGIDVDGLMLCTEDDLREAGLPDEARQKLLNFIQSRKSASRQLSSDGLEDFQRSTVTEDVKYSVGPAGTGQPYVQYPRLW